MKMPMQYENPFKVICFAHSTQFNWLTIWFLSSSCENRILHSVVPHLNFIYCELLFLWILCNKKNLMNGFNIHFSAISIQRYEISPKRLVTSNAFLVLLNFHSFIHSLVSKCLITAQENYIWISFPKNLING